MNLAVLGAQWGDEGKGKIVDLLTPSFSIVARYQGGHNAGHTVYLREKKCILRLIPSGILHPSVICVLGSNVVIDLKELFAEIRMLEDLGLEVRPRIRISGRANLILPYHRDREQHEEDRRQHKIGTTLKGIGPAYEDKVARRGVCVYDLVDSANRGRLTTQVRENVERRNQLLSNDDMSWQTVLGELYTYRCSLEPLVCDVSLLLHEAIQRGKSVMYEGAQGTLLCNTLGTYPYVTSSTPTVGGICTSLGVGLRHIGAVLGITKPYTTRVGEGPFPTELQGEIGDQIRGTGGEYGSVTGRPRRCGWFDAPVVRYAARVNGFQGLALPKLDVLDDFDEIKICTSYYPGKSWERFEIPDDPERLVECRPGYQTRPGWKQSIRGIRRFEHLPPNAQQYVAGLEATTGLPIVIIGTGPERDDYILRPWLPAEFSWMEKALAHKP